MWIALFSQTGKEIADICARNCWYNVPDVILTNRDNSHVWPTGIKPFIQVMSHEKICEYLLSCRNCIITLHGYLRILPQEVCKTDNLIYNSHPGDIISFPELKGKDPQQKALDLKLDHTGVVIHEVTSNVDSGKIVLYYRHELAGFNYNIETLTNDLRQKSVSLWGTLLRNKGVF